MRSLKAPDFASRFNVMLYREPICVLALCIDQTSKALQLQQVAAPKGESACTGAQKRTRTGQQKQILRKKVGQFVSIELFSFFWNCPTTSRRQQTLGCSTRVNVSHSLRFAQKIPPFDV
jgi:hypothetical protein